MYGSFQVKEQTQPTRVNKFTNCLSQQLHLSLLGNPYHVTTQPLLCATVLLQWRLFYLLLVKKAYKSVFVQSPLLMMPCSFVLPQCGTRVEHNAIYIALGLKQGYYAIVQKIDYEKDLLKVCRPPASQVLCRHPLCASSLLTQLVRVKSATWTIQSKVIVRAGKASSLETR